MDESATASLSIFDHADGSATYSCDGYTAIATVNGPLEVQKRDELPEEAFIDVVVRPAAGVGGTREKQLEDILHRTLRRIICVHEYPRTLIQLTIQITTTPSDDSFVGRGPQGVSGLPLLPCLLQVSVLALLSASFAMTATFTSTLLAITSSDKVIASPTVTELADASSIHVFAFTSSGRLLVAQSEGSFDLKLWRQARDRALEMCCKGEAREEEEEDEKGNAPIHTGFGLVRDEVKNQLSREQGWAEMELTSSKKSAVA